MLHRIILLALTCAMLFSTGCTCLFNPPYIDAPLIISDNSGGAIALYEVLKADDARDLYAKRIGPQGDLLWGEKVGSGYERESGSFDPRMVSDSHGGTIIAWEAFPTKPDWNLPYEEWKVHRVTTILRLDSQGNILWRREVKPFYSIVSDGSGGAIISYVDYASEAKELSVLRIDSQGNYPWGEDGVPLYFGNYSSSLRMVGDGSGGAIIVQQDLTETETKFRVLVQKVRPDGTTPWGQRGILLHSPGRSTEPTEVVSDGLGGAILAWQTNAGEDIHVQRVDAAGSILWQQDGKPLGLSKNGGRFPHRVQATADGEGGAIITWEEIGQGGILIYAQKIDAYGNTRWPLGGVQVFQFDVIQSYFISVTTDGTGGAIIVWWLMGRKEYKEGSLRAQRLDADGKVMWRDSGVPVSTGVKGHCTPATISRDGFGGILIGWGFGKNINNAERPYVQRINAEGKLLWGEEGIRLNP